MQVGPAGRLHQPLPCLFKVPNLLGRQALLLGELGERGIGARRVLLDRHLAQGALFDQLPELVTLRGTECSR